MDGRLFIKNIRYHPLKLTISCAGEGLETAHCTKGAHGVEQRTLESEIGRGLPTQRAHIKDGIRYDQFACEEPPPEQ